MSQTELNEMSKAAAADDEAKRRLGDVLESLRRLREDEHTWRRLTPGGRSIAAECGRYLRATKELIEASWN